MEIFDSHLSKDWNAIRRVPSGAERNEEDAEFSIIKESS